jgi:hypothetical protein
MDLKYVHVLTSPTHADTHTLSSCYKNDFATPKSTLVRGGDILYVRYDV